MVLELGFDELASQAIRGAGGQRDCFADHCISAQERRNADHALSPSGGKLRRGAVLRYAISGYDACGWEVQVVFVGAATINEQTRPQCDGLQARKESLIVFE